MRTNILVVVIGLYAYLFSFSSWSATSNSSCKLRSDQTLEIACTYECNKWVKRALRKRAKRNGYRINISNIFNKTVDLSTFDGFVIPGGADINPDYYIKEVVEPDLKVLLRQRDHLVNYTTEGKKRDPFEFNFLKKYFKDQSLASTPILGICRGMQVLTVSQGIPLFIDIQAEFGIKNRIWKLDKVEINDKDSLISKTVQRRSFRGVELHHQGLRLDYFRRHKKTWPHLKVTGTSNKDRIAEVLEFSNRPVLGVQFHPEYTFGKVRRSIFDWILKSACISKSKKGTI